MLTPTPVPKNKIVIGSSLKGSMRVYPLFSKQSRIIARIAKPMNGFFEASHERSDDFSSTEDHILCMYVYT